MSSMFIKYCMGPISFFSMWISSFPQIVKKMIFSTLATLLTINWSKTMDLFIGFLFCFISVYVFIPVTYSFDYWRCRIYFEIRNSDASSFILLAQECFGYSGFFVIEYQFRIIYIFYFCKNSIGILIRGVLNLWSWTQDVL